jgi:hypothetical protein
MRGLALPPRVPRVAKVFASFFKKKAFLASPGRLTLIALVLAVHAPALGAYFESDDILWLIHDRWADGWHALAGDWGLGTAYRPITRLSLLLDARLWGWHAAPWHAVNLALHAANAVLLAALAGGAGASRRDAWLIAALFAVLPVDWENVDWISGRTGLLCLLFMLAASIAALRWLRTGRGLWAACVCQALALLSYEPAALLPFALLAAALALPDAPPRRIATGLAALAGTTAGIWLLRSALLGTLRLATDVTGADYLPTLGFDLLSLGAHLWRDLSPPGFLAVAALLAAGLWQPASRRATACLLAAAALLYLPFTPVTGFTERFAYLATAPLAAALLAAAAPWRHGRLALCLLAALCAVRAHQAASGFRHAGDITRAMLARIAAIPADGSNLVFVGVPTHDGPYYLLWANFEDAVAARRPAPGFAASAEWVLRNPDLLRRALTQPTRFLAYDPATGDFHPITRASWLAQHGR